MKLKFLLIFFFTLIFYSNSIFSQTNLNLTLTYNQKNNIATANWRNPFPRTNANFNWKDQAGVTISSGSTSQNTTSTLVPINSSILSFTITIQSPRGGEPLYAKASIYFDVVIDDVVVFRASGDSNPSGLPNCLELNTPNTSGFTNYLPTLLYKIAISKIYTSTLNTNDLIAQQLNICKDTFSCPMLAASKTNFMACVRDTSHRVRSIPTSLGKLRKSKSNNTIIAYPNPFENQISFLMDMEEKGIVNIRIMDALGRIIIQNDHIISDGTHQAINIDTELLNQGIYFYQLILNDTIISKGKILK